MVPSSVQKAVQNAAEGYAVGTVLPTWAAILLIAFLLRQYHQLLTAGEADADS